MTIFAQLSVRLKNFFKGLVIGFRPKGRLGEMCNSVVKSVVILLYFVTQLLEGYRFFSQSPCPNYIKQNSHLCKEKLYFMYCGASYSSLHSNHMYSSIVWSSSSVAIWWPRKTKNGLTSFFLGWRQRYSYRVLQTIQMKLILLWVWAERAVLGRAKTALKFKYEI